VERFLAGVERRALRMAELATGNRDEALDIVQDAMLVLVRRYAGRGADDWGPLFHRILQSRIRDWYRRSRVRNRWRAWLGADDEDDDPLAALPDPGARRPEDLLGHERAGAALEAALRALPLRQQQAFLLRAWEGLDVAATAAAMGCSQGSVKTHYSRAVHTLRNLLEDHWP
jgi:RNA polymerase sigma-70 factor (ECF subfamily)